MGKKYIEDKKEDYEFKAACFGFAIMLLLFFIGLFILNTILSTILKPASSPVSTSINMEGTVIKLSEKNVKILFGEKTEYTVIIKDDKGNIYKSDKEDCYYKIYGDIKEKDNVKVEMKVFKEKDSSKILSIEKINKIE